jgi:hypothetical protein
LLGIEPSVFENVGFIESAAPAALQKSGLVFFHRVRFVKLSLSVTNVEVENEKRRR